MDLSQFLLMFTHICHMHTSHMHCTPHYWPYTALYKTPHVWPHTLVRAVGFNLYPSIRSWTISAWPSWAAKCSVVNPLWVVLWSRDCIFGARYWTVLTWPPHAALWRALSPFYMREPHNNWTHDWYNIGVDIMDSGHWHIQECIKAEYTHSVLPHTYGNDTAMY